jgi:tetratricopeptide (TPR) repeat protein
VRPPSNVRPTFPGGGNLAGGGRPSFDRPGAGTRPSFPGGNRPGGDQIANRPDFGTRPGPSFPGAGGNRPGGGDRPSFGNVTRPGGGGEGRPPIAGGGDRPGRPGGGNRPGGGGEGRPPIAGGGDRPNRPGGGGDRPIIGGGGNRPGRPGGDGRPGLRPDNIHIGDNNFNVGNRVNVGNRPNWDNNNWNRPDWGWGGGGWAGHWHDNCIRPHYGWYNGCWNGYWGSNWYAPLAWGAVGWGLGSLTSGWGYGTSYYNPYYAEAASVPYDYSQPVVVNNYAPTDTTATTDASAAPPEPAPDSPEAQATKLFDAGLAQFKSGDYRGALANFDAALAKLPGDPVVHEVRAVTLFALGDYQASAAALNSFLSSAPGMDWTTMSSLYGNVDDYQAQLRKLEQFCQAHPKDAAAFFVLAYQYLVIGSKDSAVKALQVVVKNQPQDSTARRMLNALAPATATPPAPAEVAAAPAESEGPQTDLVGNWRAKAGDTTIDLAVTADSQFTWKATQKGKPPVQLSGELAAAGNELTLDSQKQGAMAGTVKSLSADRWQFVLDGAPASDPGLSFARVN